MKHSIIIIVGSTEWVTREILEGHGIYLKILLSTVHILPIEVVDSFKVCHTTSVVCERQLSVVIIFDFSICWENKLDVTQVTM